MFFDILKSLLLDLFGVHRPAAAYKPIAAADMDIGPTRQYGEFESGIGLDPVYFDAQGHPVGHPDFEW